MAKFLVQKSGPLNGEVTISGAKNAVLPLMASALLAEEKCVLRDVPALRDVEVITEILRSLGSEVTQLEESVLEIHTPQIKSNEADYDLVSKMRASFLVMGPLLARTGRAKVHAPGG